MAVPEGYYPLCIDTENKVFFLFDQQSQQVAMNEHGFYYGDCIGMGRNFWSQVFNYSQSQCGLTVEEDSHIWYFPSENLFSMAFGYYDKQFQFISYSITTLESYHQVLMDLNTFQMGYDNQGGYGEVISIALPPIIINNTIHFVTGSQSDYTSLQTKDSNTLYFISEGKIYKGSDLMGTKNSALIASNTTNVNTTIDGNEISMNLTSDFLDAISNVGSQWGEIPPRYS